MQLVVPTRYGTFDIDVSSALALFASLGRSTQAAVLRALGSTFAPFTALLDWGDALGARRAIESIAHAPVPVISAFITSLVNNVGTSSLRFRPAGDPPSGTTPPDPWAGLAGSGLGPARDATTGVQYDPRTGQPVPAPAPGTDTGAVIGGALNRGVDTLGAYLREEGASHRAEVAANATVTSATARAEADRRIAEINADRDIRLAEIRAAMGAAASTGGDTTALQAQLQAVTAAAQLQQQQVAQQLAQFQQQAPGAGWWSTASTPAKVAVVAVPTAVLALGAWWVFKK